MADISQGWLEAQLSRQMAQVKAPDSLWAGIQRERRTRRVPVGRAWMLWPVIATVLVLASGDLLWEVGRARGVRIESNNPAEIRSWVKARTNLDVDLNCGGNGKVLLSGARLMEFKDRVVAAISYKLGGQDGTMLVSRLVSRKGAMPGPEPETRLVSWSNRNQIFALTYPPARELDASCVGCHMEGHGQL